MPKSVRRGLTDRQPLPPRQRQRGRLSLLGRDIALILVVKFAVLGGLWWVFFSHPVARHMSVEPQRVDAHLLSSPSTGSAPEPPRADR
jgi:hypothetical protein